MLVNRVSTCLVFFVFFYPFKGILWYAILCYALVSSVLYAMVFLCYAMGFVCYAMVYVVNDKHSATVPWIRTRKRWTRIEYINYVHRFSLCVQLFMRNYGTFILTQQGILTSCFFNISLQTIYIKGVLHMLFSWHYVTLMSYVWYYLS